MKEFLNIVLLYLILLHISIHIELFDRLSELFRGRLDIDLGCVQRGMPYEIRDSNEITWMSNQISCRKRMA